jgi:hypothetical protein
MKWLHLGDPHKGYAVHGHHPRGTALFHGIKVQVAQNAQPGFLRDPSMPGILSGVDRGREGESEQLDSRWHPGGVECGA